MKTSARFLAMLLAVLMIASAALSVSAFSDVAAGTDHASAISVLSQLGVIGGYEDGTFKPDQNVTRAEMAKLVYVLYTTFTDAGAGSVKFNDVKADNWAAGYISWCAGKGIIGGYGDGNFGPSDNVTYDQALKMVAGTLGYNEWDSTLWPTDVRLKALNELKLGKDIPSSVKGGDKLTRGQVAQIMYNALFAPMKETKSESTVLGGLTVYLPVPKVLANDVWNFVETTYTINGTENYGNKTSADDKLAIQQINADGTRTYMDGETEKTYEVETMTLEELGLAAYEGKTDNLINLYIKTVTKDEEMLESATILGSVTDGVSAVYPKSRKFIKINGVEYTAKNFDGTAKDQIALYDIKGNALETTVFGSDDLLDTEFVKTLDPNAQNTVRIVDFDGDGDVDAFVITPKYAFEVKEIKNKTVDGKAVPHVYYATLAGVSQTEIPVANVSVALAEKDVFVGALVGDTLYAEVVKPVEALATSIKVKTGEITLEEVGTVKYTERTLAGVDTVSLDATILEEDDAQVYYIYNGEIIRTTAAATATDYNFAIFQNIEETEGAFNEVTMEEDTAYEVTLLVIEEGKLVEKKVILAGGTETAAYVDTTPYTAAEMFAAKNGEKNVFAHNFNEDGKRDYNYMIVAAYEESTKGGYVLTFDKNLDADKYVTVAAGADFIYNPSTKLYSFDLEGTENDQNMVVVDSNSVIYYHYTKPLTASGSFEYLGMYTADSLTAKRFTAKTTGISYLLVDEEEGTATLLATIVDKEIEGVSDDTIDFTNDGRLIMYAPETSEVVRDSGKRYNKYVFMDNATLTTKDAVLDKTVEYDATKNPGTEAGYLYGYDTENDVYKAITASSVAALSLETVKASTLTNVIPTRSLIAYGSAKESILVDSTVTIWGLAEEDKNDSYKQLSLEDLKAMFDIVKEYNENNGEAADLEIDILMFYYEDANDDMILSSIIVEIYEIAEDDETETPVSVNDIIFENYKDIVA